MVLRRALGGIYETVKELFKKSDKKGSVCVTRQKRIAVIISNEKNWWAVGILQRFVVSLREQLGAEHVPAIDIYSAYGDRGKLLTAMNTVVERGADAVLSVGTWCTKEVRDYLESTRTDIPQVFCAAIDPVGIGIVDSYERPGRNVSGVAMTLFDYASQMSSLRAICPALSQLVIVHGSYDDDAAMSGVIARQMVLLREACAAHGIKVCVCAVSGESDLEEKLSAILSGGQVQFVCTFSDFAILSSMELVIELCKKYKVPLCSAELASVYRGAAVGFGEHPSVFGRYGALFVADVLSERRLLINTPVLTVPRSSVMRFNLEALQSQGVVLDARTRDLLTMCTIFMDA